MWVTSGRTVDYRIVETAMIMTRLPKSGRPLGLLALVFAVPACVDQEAPKPVPVKGGGGDEVTVAAAQEAQGMMPSVTTEMVYDFDEWHDDFPYALHVPHRKPGLWYDRNSQEALEKVISNLSGMCTKPAWLMSKEFFDRHWEESRELLVEALDAAQRRRDQYDLAENIVNAMGRCSEGLFADVLVRASVHSHPGIRTAAFRALRNGGDEAAVLKVGESIRRMGQVEQIEWVKAAMNKLSDEKLLPILRDMLTRQEYVHLQNHAFEAAMKLPPKRAAGLFEPLFDKLAGDLQLYVAGLMHGLGDERGTARIRIALKPPVKILTRKMVAVRGAMMGDASLFRDELLELTNEDNEGLNLALISALRSVPGDNVTDTLITMSDQSKPFPVRQAALQALVERGVTSEFEGLLEVLKTSPKNTRFRAAVADVVAAKYGRAVPFLLQRANDSTPKERVFFVRMIAAIGTKESFEALKAMFMAPEYRYVGWRERHSNVTFMGVHFSNLSGSTSEMLGLLGELPRQEYRRRAALVHALANLAGARPTEDFTKQVYAALRKIIFDRQEVPQLRILALDYLRKDVRLQDAMKLKASLNKEAKSVRQYFSDYLIEFF